MEKSGVTFEVRVHGKKVREYEHQGKIYVEGRRGSEFTLHIKNPYWSRILVVPSVDGLSVMDGEPASYDSGGYVIEPYSTLSIPGWRLNDEAAAKFFFADKQKGYATQSSNPHNIGVIGCAVFFEQPKPATYTLTGTTYGGTDWTVASPWTVTRQSGQTSRSTRPTSYTCSSNTLLDGCTNVSIDTNAAVGVNAEACAAVGVNAEACAAVGVNADIATGFGAKTKFAVSSTTFQRTAEPFDLLEIYYASRAALKAAGVTLTPKPQVASAPNAFPRQSGCKPPKGWRG